MLVGLSGKARSGKDTVASYLVLSHNFVRFAFADALKQVALAMGWNGKKDEKGRRFLQQLGHATVQVTLDLYGHLLPEVEQESVKKLDEMVGAATASLLNS